jgi:restriction endonuclease S subunit
MKSNWKKKTVGELCTVVAGQSPEGKYYNKDGEGLAFYQGKKEFGEKFIKEPKVWTTNITKEALAGDILMSVRAPVGPTNFAVKKICIGRGLAAIRSGKDLETEYLYYFLKYFEDSIQGNEGAVFNSISKGQIESIEILTPDTEEQKRIVKKLDKIFEELEKAKEFAEKNLQNSKELFESYLQNTFTDPSKDWETTTLGEAYDVRDGTHDSPKYQKQGYALVTSKNLKRDLLNLENIKFISEKDYLLINKRSKVSKGDILFAMIGTIGNPVVVKDDPDFAIKNVALFKIPKEQDGQFLKYFLDSKFVIDKMLSEAKGTTQKFVGLGYLRSFDIWLPLIKEQKRIVKKLDSLSVETRKLEVIYEQKLSDLEELKKSVLAKAFNAEL